MSVVAKPVVRDARYWLLTIPVNDWEPCLPEKAVYIKGQKEKGTETGYLHWQVYVALIRPMKLAYMKKIFPITAHCEMSRSKACEEYVWKEETRIEGSQFELGEKMMKRNSKLIGLK